MSNTTPPPEFPPPLPPELPAPAPKKTRTNAVVIGSAAAIIAAIVTTGVVVVKSSNTGNKPATAATSSAPTLAATEPDPSPSYDQVTADSFTIKLKTTSRQCFGEAGCNLTVEPNLTYLGDSNSIDPNAVYEITYEIHGDESGPVIETAKLTDRTSLNFTPSMISTPSASTNVSVEITDVTAQTS